MCFEGDVTTDWHIFLTVLYTVTSRYFSKQSYLLQTMDIFIFTRPGSRPCAYLRLSKVCGWAHDGDIKLVNLGGSI